MHCKMQQAPVAFYSKLRDACPNYQAFQVGMKLAIVYSQYLVFQSCNTRGGGRRIADEDEKL